MEIRNIENERYCLSALIRFPNLYSDISFFVKSDDYTSKIHKTIYQIIGDILKKGEDLSVYAINEKIKNLGIKTSEVEDVFGYLEAIENLQINEKGAIKFFQDLGKTTIRREIAMAGNKLAKEMGELKDSSIEEILAAADKIYATTISNFQKQCNEVFVDLYDNIESLVHERIKEQGEKPLGFETPFKRINEIYGPLARAGNISMVAARTGVGKTSIGLYLANSIATKYKIPVCHLDSSEMSEWEVRQRAIVQFTGGKVNLNLVESGDWRKNPETEKLVSKALKIMENYNYHYFDIGDLQDEEIFSLLRRFKLTHCSVLGGDNQFFTLYDYIKPRETTGYTKEYEQLGYFMKKMKNFFKNEAKAPLHTSLQINKTGIVTNKNSNMVDDSDSAFGLSDRINQQVSVSFTLREFTLDEQAAWPNMGNLMLIPNKARFGGRDIMDIKNPVKMNDGSIKKNRIFFENENFCFKEISDLKTLAPNLNNHSHPEPDNENVDI